MTGQAIIGILFHSPEMLVYFAGVAFLIFLLKKLNRI